MGLTYTAKRKGVESVDLNVSGCDVLAEVHKKAGLPTDPHSQGRRVPYTASATEVKAWAVKLVRAPAPRGFKWLQRRWLTFLRACEGYEAV
jgi:hypothetical protein